MVFALLSIATAVAMLLCGPAMAIAQTSTMFSNLANPAIGMNALFDGQAAPTLNEPYGLKFDSAEISLIAVVDPYWTLVSNIVFASDGTVDPEEVWARSTNIPTIQLKLGKIRPAIRVFLSRGESLGATDADYRQERCKQQQAKRTFHHVVPFFDDKKRGFPSYFQNGTSQSGG